MVVPNYVLIRVEGISTRMGVLYHLELAEFKEYMEDRRKWFIENDPDFPDKPHW